MNTKTVKSVIKEFIVSLLGFAFIIFILFNCYTLYSVWRAYSYLPERQQQEYIRFMIYGSSSSPEGNTISASFSIVDSNGNEISKIERSWVGNYLAVEFAETGFDDKTFLFPTAIYGKERIMQTKSGRRKTSLEKFYDDNGQCLLLGFGSTYKERNELYKIARFATKKLPVFTFGRVSLYSLDLSSCKINRYYSIQRISNGNLVVVEL